MDTVRINEIENHQDCHLQHLIFLRPSDGLQEKRMPKCKTVVRCGFGGESLTSLAQIKSKLRRTFVY